MGASLILGMFKNGKFRFDRRDLHCHFKGNTSVQSYTPTAEEKGLQKQALEYSKAIQPNARSLNTKAYGLLNKSLGDTKVDYNQLNKTAQNQINKANTMVANLANGKLPANYQKNMEDSIKRGVTNSMGGLLTDLGNRGVINSSVMNTGVQGINDAAATAMSDAYTQNVGLLSQLAGQQTDQATAGITAAAAAQEAAQQPALNLWSASLGLNQGGTLGALAGVSGKGTTTTTQSGGNDWLGGLFSGLGGIASAFCFAEDTLIKMASGPDKKIKRVEPGDVVICPHSDGTETEEEVLEVMEPHRTHVYVVVAKDANNIEHVTYTTMTQPLMNSEGEFVKVEDITLRTVLKGGWRITNIVYSGERKVYDLKVSGENNYYADGFVAKGGTTEW